MRSARQKLTDGSLESERLVVPESTSTPSLDDVTAGVGSTLGTKLFDDETTSQTWNIGILLGSTMIVYADMLLDGRVSVTLMNQHFKTVVGLLCGISLVPQLIIWTFLKMNGMTNMWSLLRIVVGPCLGALVGLTALLEVHRVPGGWWLLLMFVSFEPGWTLYRSLRSQPVREMQEGFWAAVGEGLIEAPCSACITLYLAILTAAFHQKHSLDTLFTASVGASILSITRIATKLHYYGHKNVSWTKWFFTFFVMKLPQTTSQILAFSIFAFLTRPFPDSKDDLKGTSSYTVFLFLLQELVLNLNMLRTLSPSMTPAVAALFAAAMAFSGPPGFLTALDAARIPHAAQHFTLVGVMFGTAYFRASSLQHWEYLWKEHMPLLLTCGVSWLAAFVVNLIFARNPLDKKEALKLADTKLEEAIREGDYIMGTLLMEVEGVKLPSIRMKFLKLGTQGAGTSKWSGVCSMGMKLYFAPSSAKEILVLDPSHEDDSGKVSFIPLAVAPKDKDKDKTKAKYSGIALHSSGKLYCAPDEAKDILVIDPVVSSYTQVPLPQVKREPLDSARHFMAASAAAAGIAHGDTKTKVSHKYNGICELHKKLYCAPASAKDAIVIEADNYEGTAKVSDLHCHLEDGHQLKYSGMCTFDGKIYCAPFHAKEVMVIDPAADSSRVTYIPLGPAYEDVGGKFDGVCSFDGKLYFAPYNSHDVLVLDPYAVDEVTRITSLPLHAGSEGPGWLQAGAKYSGICTLGGKMYCAPYDAEEMLVIDPWQEQAENKVSFVPLGARGRLKNKWQGICALGGKVYCSPADAPEVLVVDPVGADSLAAHVESAQTGALVTQQADPAARSFAYMPGTP